jgi:hypothetical protein
LSTQKLVSRVLAGQPNPPRTVSFLGSASAVLGDQSGLSALVFGIGSVVVALVVWLSGDSFFIRLLAVPFVIFSVAVLSIPALYVRHLTHSLRVGILTTAEVVALDAQSARSSTTLNSLRYGVAKGRRVVHHTRGDFEDSFRTDQGGAGRLRVGSTMQVLVAPDQPRVLFSLPTN